MSRFALVQRLGAALAASIALHALLVAGLAQVAGSSIGGDAPGTAALAGMQVWLRAAHAETTATALEAAAAPASRGASEATAETTPLQVAQSTGGGVDRPGEQPAAAIPLPQRYYTTRDLEARPQVAIPVMPAYPERIGLEPVSVKVQLRLYISETGIVDEVRILERRADDPYARAAAEAFAAARFTPGMREGRAVPSQIAIEVSFDAGAAAGAAGAATGPLKPR